MAPKVDVRIVIAVSISVISIIQVCFKQNVMFIMPKSGGSV